MIQLLISSNSPNEEGGLTWVISNQLVPAIKEGMENMKKAFEQESGGFFGKTHFAKKTANVLLKKLSPNKSYRIIISHCNCSDRANNLLNILKNTIKNIDYSYVIDCGSALGVHIGQGS